MTKIYFDPRAIALQAVPLDDNGVTQPGAVLAFYLTQTSQLADIWSDDTLQTPLNNPITADDAGRFVAIYLDSAVVYRAVLHNAQGVLLSDTDPYVGGILIVNDIQVFTSNGTWTKPTDGKIVEIIEVGGGGGGGGGETNGSPPSFGAGGGGGGGYSRTTILANLINSTVAVTVGAGGAGGAGGSGTGNVPGTSGSPGGNSSFGNYLTAFGGGGGISLGAGSPLGGAGGSGSIDGGEGGKGGTSNSPSDATPGIQVKYAGGGGGGGAHTNNNSNPGASGGAGPSLQLTPPSAGAGGLGGGNTGGAGGTNIAGYPGAGGGGGGSIFGGLPTPVVAGNGGAGGSYGGGGGGGGGAQTNDADFKQGGHGGAGAPGIVIIITSF